MSYGLLWIETLCVALLLIATVAAIAGRLGRRTGELLVAIAVMIVEFCLAAVATTTAALKFGLGVEANWFEYGLSLFVASILGVTVLLRVARRRPGPGMATAGATWPRSRFALALAAAAALTSVTLWTMDARVRARAARVRTDARAALIAVSPRQVEADRNAAVVYAEAFARLDADPELRNPDAVLVDDSTDPTRTSVSELLARHTAAIRLLRETARLPACRFEHDYADPKTHMLVPELNSARRAANVLRLDANRAIAAGDEREAVDDVNAIFRLSRGVRDEPMLVAGLVGMGVDQVGITTTEEIVRDIQRPEDLAALNLGDAAGIRWTLRRCVQAEEAFGAASLGDLADGRMKLRELLDGPRRGPARAASPDLMDYAPFAVLMRVFFIPDDLRAYRQCMEAERARAAEPYYRPEAAAALEEIGLHGKRSGLLTSILVPDLNRAFQTEAEDEALHAAGQVGVAVARYRLDHNAFPPNFDALVPRYLDEIPHDPFDGKPLRYRNHGDDFLLYSLGPDRKDDGGAPFDQRTGSGDLVFTVKSSRAPMPASGPTKW
jgi:hypothetical protein